MRIAFGTDDTDRATAQEILDAFLGADVVDDETENIARLSR